MPEHPGGRHFRAIGIDRIPPDVSVIATGKKQPFRRTGCNPSVTVSSRKPKSGDNDQLFRILVQGVVDYAIYMLDPAGNISNWNVGGERIKGYAADEVVGRHFSMFYTEEDRARGLPARALTTAARDGRFADEGWRVRKDGSRFWASCIIDRILDDHGGLLGFAKVTRDLTEQKSAQEELERTRAVLAQSQKMEAIGQLTGGVAHDFNNLLTVITNSLDLLSAPTRDEAQRRRVIRSAQRAAERGAKLTQQLLAFSRRQPLRPEIHDIHALLGGFEAVLRRACPAPIEFEIDPSPLPLAADIDAPQFETALLNLVVNARDAMPQGGTLRIATGRERIDAERATTMGEIAAGDYVTRVGQRQRRGHGACRAAARLRAVLHDQRRRQGQRARAQPSPNQLAFGRET